MHLCVSVRYYERALARRKDDTCQCLPCQALAHSMSTPCPIRNSVFLSRAMSHAPNPAAPACENNTTFRTTLGVVWDFSVVLAKGGATCRGRGVG